MLVGEPRRLFPKFVAEEVAVRGVLPSEVPFKPLVVRNEILNVLLVSSLLSLTFFSSIQEVSIGGQVGSWTAFGLQLVAQCHRHPVDFTCGCL